MTHEYLKESKWNAELDLYRIEDIYNSVSHNQIASKTWLAECAAPFIMDEDKMCILGSWYGVLTYILRQHRVGCEIDNIDTDGPAKEIAEKLIQEPPGLTNYYYMDGTERYLDSKKWYTVICTTSTEHFEEDDWELITRSRPEETLFIAQSNNNTSELEHINCHESCDHLAESMRISDIYYQESKEFKGVEGSYLRHLVIGK